jgi:hypothetical protein
LCARIAGALAAFSCLALLLSACNGVGENGNRRALPSDVPTTSTSASAQWYVNVLASVGELDSAGAAGTPAARVSRGASRRVRAAARTALGSTQPTAALSTANAVVRIVRLSLIGPDLLESGSVSSSLTSTNEYLMVWEEPRAEAVVVSGMANTPGVVSWEVDQERTSWFTRQGVPAERVALFLLWRRFGERQFSYYVCPYPAWIIARCGDQEAGILLGNTGTGATSASGVALGTVFEGSELRDAVARSYPEMFGDDVAP